MTNENLIIENISQFYSLLKEKKEIVLKKEVIDGIEIGSIFYNISDKDTFNTLLARECRGITFDMATGNVLARPLHKFFNINEKEDTQWNSIDWDNVTYIGTKFDGSMVYPVLINDKIYFRTKKGFNTDIAERATKFFNNRYILHDSIISFVKDNETPVFEYIAPDNQIVIKYPKEELKLLHIRNNKTGQYTYKTEFYNIIKDVKENALDYIKKIYENETEIEGYVVYDGKDFYKQKTKWYLDRHHSISTLSYKKVIEMVLNNTIDDTVSFLRDLNLTDRCVSIEKIRKEIVDYYNKTNNEILKEYKNFEKILDKKDLALKTKGNKFSHFFFSLYHNKPYEEDLKKNIGKVFLEKYKSRKLFI